MRLTGITSSLVVVALAACKPTLELPTESHDVTLPGSPQQVICHVEAVSRRLGLSVYYGHNEMNDVIAFRLIESDYEVDAVNALGGANYNLSLYDRSRSGPARQMAKRTFARVLADLKQGEPTSCPKSN